MRTILLLRIKSWRHAEHYESQIYAIITYSDVEENITATEKAQTKMR